MQSDILVVRARVEEGIPKLLVKVNPTTSDGFCIKNLGEVSLRKPGGARGHVAVLHLSASVPPGESLLSLKLAELLDIAEGDEVHVTKSEREAQSPRKPSSRTSASRPGSGGSGGSRGSKGAFVPMSRTSGHADVLTGVVGGSAPGRILGPGQMQLSSPSSKPSTPSQQIHQQPGASLGAQNSRRHTHSQAEAADWLPPDATNRRYSHPVTSGLAAKKAAAPAPAKQPEGSANSVTRPSAMLQSASEADSLGPSREESPSQTQTGSGGKDPLTMPPLIPRQRASTDKPVAATKDLAPKGPTALVHVRSASRGPVHHSSKSRRSSLQRNARLSFGALQQGLPCAGSSVARAPLPSHWQQPLSTGGGLERSELGSEITVEIQNWLNGESTGLQCSQVVMDKALTCLSNFKLSSGCELEVLGGPLGAIVGGYSEADWLYHEVFQKESADAVQEAFELLGFPCRGDGDWSGYMVEEVSLAYRRQCLRGHPSRGGSSRSYLKLQVAMELVRAFCGEASCDAEEHEVLPAPTFSKAFVLDDRALARELALSPKEVEAEADSLSTARLEELNRAVDEYILRQMCFKSEIVHEIARLHENSAYSILGVAPDASDAEIKKAFRVVAMQCHPDKGGDKAEFQEVHEAYEKIMEQRKSTANLASHKAQESSGDEASGTREEPSAKAADKASKEDQSSDKPKENGEAEAEGTPEAEEAEEAEDEQKEDGSEKSLLEKAAKAADEASRYAKTAAEFSHQAAEAAETARQGRDQGSHESLTKSIAHSAIVLTLTVVKAVRVVGYATMDVSAQCRLAARKFPEAQGCADCSTEAMSLGLEALNAALACAEVTETTAAELQASPSDAAMAASDRFIAAAVRASLAAASASNAAMSAAIAAVEGNRQCMEAVQARQKEAEAEAAKAEEPEEMSEEKTHGSKEDEPLEEEPDTARKPSKRQPSAEEMAAASAKRQVTQRNNNCKVLQRLNAELLTHQQNVRQFLQANRQLIPEISIESKGKVYALLRDFAREVLSEVKSNAPRALAGDTKELLHPLVSTGLLVPFLQPQTLAIPVSVKARVLKMAALYDLPLTIKVLEDELFCPVRRMLSQIGASKDMSQVDDIAERVQKELKSHVDEDAGIAVP
eukprot:TRINITY_DN39249_c0_g1_i1.p1 TRINITY_DN39249_c0_g1~~TRINITY_DN39249_c0_g1_i1.p1  ORF type:complete len:1127 (+),score=272.68 TRINITY_DN39249_c0_g1_i1:115-3495(+)